ncbi:MAG: tRNA uracil 4-sulfurtransferase ThiI [Pseudomonadota bacterium]
MQYVVKFFSEIVIKSKPVRQRFINHLTDNLRAVLVEIDPEVLIHRRWDKLQIQSSAPEQVQTLLVDALCRTSGITYVLQVETWPLPPLKQIVDRVLPVYAKRLAGSSFAVRCKRTGKHTFSSIEVEREVGSAILARTDAAGVQLKDPQVTVEMEICDDTLFVISERYRGLGGYPVGSVDPVLSLISGGFDSPVASFLTMKRGMCTHFLFFNLGGRDHEIGVKEIALYLWQKYGCNQRVLFVTVPFEEVVAELMCKVRDSHMGVVLKRMMLRVAQRVAHDLDVDALVTGESVSQVSSQTLRNLAVIDDVAECLVLRPLITTDKEQIMGLAETIGTAEFAAGMPEYCGITSVKPTTRARLDRIVREEAGFDRNLLERAFEGRRQACIDQLATAAEQSAQVEVLTVPLAHGTIIDIRHPEDEQLSPLKVSVPVAKIPFYELQRRATELSGKQTYMLYCGKGVMSRLHASHLAYDSKLKIKVYAP